MKRDFIHRRELREFQSAANRSSGFRSRILPRRFTTIPARSQSVRQRLTVNGDTFAPSAKSSFKTLISTPSSVASPIALARLTSKWATRPCASSELSETCAAVDQAMFSVTAIDKTLSNRAGRVDANSRMVCLSHTSAQLSVSTSVQARYWYGVERIAAPPKICPALNQCRSIFRPLLVITKCLP